MLAVFSWLVRSVRKKTRRLMRKIMDLDDNDVKVQDLERTLFSLGGVREPPGDSK